MTAADRERDPGTVFRLFAERECDGRSPLYAALAKSVARDDDLLALADGAGAGQPRPNLLFAAAHYLLLRDRPDHDLARYYPSLTDRPAAPGQAFPAFKAFCAERRADIAALLASRRVATNEVGRSACLLPAFLTVARLAPAPLHVIEIGAGAGLNLLWDRFSYVYGPDLRYGPPSAPLTLRCELRGGGRPALRGEPPAVGYSLGIDIAPVDAADPDDALWLRALVWPEQRARAARLAAALALAAQIRPEVRRGDGIELMAKIAGEIEMAGTLCVVHCFTLNQASDAARNALEEVLIDLGRRRPLWRIAFEWGCGPAPELALSRYHGGRKAVRLLAYGDAHGQWLDWRGGAPDDRPDRRAIRE